MSLLPGYFPEMIMAFLWGFESADSVREQFLEFVTIVDPMGTESRSVSDKLAPNGSSKPLLEGDILDCVNAFHESNCSLVGVEGHRRFARAGREIGRLAIEVGFSLETEVPLADIVDPDFDSTE